MLALNQHAFAEDNHSVPIKSITLVIINIREICNSPNVSCRFRIRRLYISRYIAWS